MRQAASDVLLIAGVPVSLRVNGALTPASGPALAAEDTRSLLLPLLAPKQYQDLQQNKSVDLCFTREGIGRFRANVHHQRGTLAGSIRLLPDKIPIYRIAASSGYAPAPGRSPAGIDPDHRSHRMRQKLHASRDG